LRERYCEKSGAMQYSALNIPWVKWAGIFS